LLKCIEQVVSVLFADVFDGEAESDGPCNMAPETGYSSARVIAMRCRGGNELVVCEAAGLGEAVHAVLDFDYNSAIDNESLQVVGVDDFLVKQSD
jgi:hypothetical protein